MFDTDRIDLPKVCNGNVCDMHGLANSSANHPKRTIEGFLLHKLRRLSIRNSASLLSALLRLVHLEPPGNLGRWVVASQTN